jgi:hypothetical protein
VGAERVVEPFCQAKAPDCQAKALASTAIAAAVKKTS